MITANVVIARQNHGRLRLPRADDVRRGLLKPAQQDRQAIFDGVGGDPSWDEAQQKQMAALYRTM